MAGIKGLVRAFLESKGYKVDLVRPELEFGHIQASFLRKHGVTQVIDVGANCGQYSQEIRDHGFQGTIYAFEPLSSAFTHLAQRAKGDDQWVAVQAAVGDQEGTATINIASNSESSSLLPMHENHVRAAEYSRYVGTEEVKVVTLDGFLAGKIKPEDRVFLKIDAQGFTNQVLAGAATIMPNVVGLFLELSCVQLYEGEPLAGEVIRRFEELGFRIWFVQNEFRDLKTQQMMQINALFFKAEG